MIACRRRSWMPLRRIRHEPRACSPAERHPPETGGNPHDAAHGQPLHGRNHYNIRPVLLDTKVEESKIPRVLSPWQLRELWGRVLTQPCGCWRGEVYDVFQYAYARRGQDHCISLRKLIQEEALHLS